ncbi:MAG TPA: hypothetical protein VNX68_10005 [Nitrosopumilaceae archaeon]|jgi:hypothetical protein|nr:hypothetical protein [Nitrosopumilaceae archaeon]
MKKRCAGAQRFSFFTKYFYAILFLLNNERNKRTTLIKVITLGNTAVEDML